MFIGHALSFSLDGVCYNFDHMTPVTVFLRLAQGTVLPAEVRFKSHCYTRERLPGEPTDGLVRHDDERGNERYFCPHRYRLSLCLFGWITGWCHQACLFGRNYRYGVENFIIVETDAGEPVKVAFSIDKHDYIKLGLLIWIKTVHPYDRSAPSIATRSNSLPFNTLAKTVAYTGQRPSPR